MRTKKVNFFTIFTNYLTKNGRRANIEIAEMQGPVYQKRLRNGNIALLNENKCNDTFMIIKKDCSVNIKNSQKVEKDSYKLLSFLKEYYDKSSQKVKGVSKEVFYYCNRIEEIARKTKTLDGSSELKIVSAGERKTLFHQTRLAGSLHPAMAEKTIMQNGDIVYIERYPQISL